jgi:hypothetical protein
MDGIGEEYGLLRAQILNFGSPHREAVGTTVFFHGVASRPICVLNV